MSAPGDNNSDNSTNGEYRANRWSNPSGDAANQGAGYPSFGAQPQPGPGAYPTAPDGGANQDSFFSALFDFSFTRYATPSIIKFAYALGFAFIALLWVGYVLFALIAPASEFGVGGFVLGLFGVVILTIGMLFMLMSLRMMLEFYLSNIRIAQSAQSIDQRLLERPGGQTGRY
ncbi:DUF4282 domain-containing protein [Corynebacterium glyciniphilum]|uniref:Putative membrane protein n=1 Tax=Corynebacterium glyciniphilum AJ 3170 TaxID=1404245 RepID=X5DT69_9CORY|nr:DUF4282 domain-containing protein [Corynebacterium glyciniphilum]AHW64494.1 Putative membrane protein [Corynebacterium glyciniphilum AJ 3170]